MANGIPCPNPQCSHVFPPKSVSGALALKCPLCGAVYKLRTIPQKPAPAAAPPVATAATPAAPSLSSFALPDASPVALRRAATRRRIGWGKLFVLFLVLGGLVGGLGYAGWRWRSLFLDESGAELPGTVSLYPQLNCRYNVPDKPWVSDNEVKSHLKALVALRRTRPEVTFALVVRDFKDRTPRDGEVRDEAIKRLSAYFADSLEWEPAEDSEIAGLPAQRLIFRGEGDEGSMAGECHLLAYQGVAYWLITWAPAEAVDRAQDDFVQLRQRFGLLRERESWGEKRNVQTFRGQKAGYLLRDTEGIWKEWTPATDHDPLADLALVAREREAPREEERKEAVAATALVLVLEGVKGDLKAAVEAARAHLEEQQKAIYPDTVLEPVGDKALAPEKEGNVGKARGHVVRLLVKNGESRQRFVLLGVVPQAESVLVVQCECDWKRRGLWERDFTQLLGTFQLRSDANR